MRTVHASIVCAAAAAAAMFVAGCEVRLAEPVVAVRPAVVTVAPAPVVVEDPAVVVAPGVVAIDVEPAIALRTYCYDPGFPPGVYLCGGFYYWGDHRYPHDVFIDRVVHVNIQKHVYMNVEENRRAGAKIEAAHREQFSRTGGKHVMQTGGKHEQPQPTGRGHEDRRDDHKDEPRH